MVGKNPAGAQNKAWGGTLGKGLFSGVLAFAVYPFGGCGVLGLVGLAYRFLSVKNIVGGVMKDGNGLRGVRRKLGSKLGELRKGLPIYPVGKLGLLLGLVHRRVGCGIQNMAGLKTLNGLGNRRAE